jgi:chromate transporter
MNPQKKLSTLFFALLKIGLFTFGGGYAMIALLENEFVTRRGWLEREEFLNIAAIAESTPGPIAINAATYVGYNYAGIIGAIVATIAICIPSFIIIYLISLCLDAFLSFHLIYCAFRGIQVCVVYLILSAGLRMLTKMKKTPFNLTVVGLTFAGMLAVTLLSVRFSTVIFILIGGTAGLVVYLLKNCSGGKS